MNKIRIKDFEQFQIDVERGFLPAHDPLQRLPKGFEQLERVAQNISALLMTHKLRVAIERLIVPDIARLEDGMQLQRAMLLLSVLGNAYVWETQPAARSIPAQLAVPWCAVAEKVGRPPVTAHTSIVHHNWRRLDKDGPITEDNLAALQIFLGGMDEQWFYMTTVAIEAKGGPALVAMVDAQSAVVDGHIDTVLRSLKTIKRVLEEMHAILLRIPEKCDPYIFYNRVRPYLSSWPEPGVVYEGVSETPQMLAGGSAAQSPLLQSLDAILGIAHPDNVTSPFLLEMRHYMSPAHRKFIEALEEGASLRQFVLERSVSHPTLSDQYNQCVEALDRFRKVHMEIAVRYILHQAASPEEAVGTGGTSFVPFLSKARKETQEKLIDP